MPVYLRGSLFKEWAWDAFRRQNYENKWLYVCYNHDASDPSPDETRSALEFWKQKQRESNGRVVFWDMSAEEFQKTKLGGKRQQMVNRMAKNVKIDLVAHFDDDDFYGEDYLSTMAAQFDRPEVMIAKAKSFHCLALYDRESERARREGEASRARRFLDIGQGDPNSGATANDKDKYWAALLKHGWMSAYGFSYVIRMSAFKKGCTYGMGISGEEDHLWITIMKKFGNRVSVEKGLVWADDYWLKELFGEAIPFNEYGLGEAPASTSPVTAAQLKALRSRGHEVSTLIERGHVWNTNLVSFLPPEVSKEVVLHFYHLNNNFQKEQQTVDRCSQLRVLTCNSVEFMQWYELPDEVLRRLQDYPVKDISEVGRQMWLAATSNLQQLRSGAGRFEQ